MKLLSILACAGLASATTYRATIYHPGSELDGMELVARNYGFYVGVDNTPQTYCPGRLTDFECPPVRGTLVYDVMRGLAVAVPGGQSIYVAADGTVSYTRAHSASIPYGAFPGGWYKSNATTGPTVGQNATVTSGSPLATATGRSQNATAVTGQNATVTSGSHNNITAAGSQSVTVVKWKAGPKVPGAKEEARGGIGLCPVIEPGWDFRLYANTPGFRTQGCIWIAGLVENSRSDEYGAWQYI